MAYELKRSERIQEEIKVGEDIISISLDVDTISKEFNKRYNKIISAEHEMKKIQASEDINADNLNAIMETYGEAVVELFALVFGEDGATKILKFYENNYFEMSMEVFPFIIDVVVPQIQKSLVAQRERLAGQYKQKAAFLGGSNRNPGRKLGL